MGLVHVDADYKFIWADVGGSWTLSDAQIYNNSELFGGSDAGEARTRSPSVSSQALYHWATASHV